jgi:hypothetical protein
MRFQSKVYCAVAVLTIVAAYVCGVGFSPACDEGCKSVSAYRCAGYAEGRATVYGSQSGAQILSSCYLSKMWVNTPEEGAYGLLTDCSTAYVNAPVPKVYGWGCNNCNDACDYTEDVAREMSAPATINGNEDCDDTFGAQWDQKACG